MTFFVDAGVRSSCNLVNVTHIAIVQTRNTHIKVISDDHHRCIAAGTLAFDLNNGKRPVRGRLARFYSIQLFADRVQDVVCAS